MALIRAIRPIRGRPKPSRIAITLNCQLSTVNYQLSTVNYQLSIINYQLSTIPFAPTAWLEPLE